MNEQENPIIEQVKGMAQLKWGHAQQKYFEQIAKDCRPVECKRMRDVLTAKQLEFIKTFYHTQQKQCYRNAAELVFMMERPIGCLRNPCDTLRVTRSVAFRLNTHS